MRASVSAVLVRWRPSISHVVCAIHHRKRDESNRSRERAFPVQFGSPLKGRRVMARMYTMRQIQHRSGCTTKSPVVALQALVGTEFVHHSFYSSRCITHFRPAFLPAPRLVPVICNAVICPCIIKPSLSKHRAGSGLQPTGRASAVCPVANAPLCVRELHPASSRDCCMPSQTATLHSRLRPSIRLFATQTFRS